MAHAHVPKALLVPPTRDGTISLVMGILALTLPLLALVFGPLGIHYARKQSRIAPTGMATAGLVCSVIGLAVFVLIIGVAGCTFAGLVLAGSSAP